MSIVETGQAGGLFPGMKVCQNDFESSLRIGTEPEQLSFLNKLSHSSVIDLHPLGDQVLIKALVRLVPKIREDGIDDQYLEKTYMFLSRLSPEAATACVGQYIASLKRAKGVTDSSDLVKRTWVLPEIVAATRQKSESFRQDVFKYVWQEAAELIALVAAASERIPQLHVEWIMGYLRACVQDESDQSSAEIRFLTFLVENNPSTLFFYQDFLYRQLRITLTFDSVLPRDSFYMTQDFNKKMIEFDARWTLTTRALQQHKPPRLKIEKDLFSSPSFEESFRRFFESYLENGHGNILEFAEISKRLRTHFSITDHPYKLDENTLRCFEAACQVLNNETPFAFEPTRRLPKNVTARGLINALPIIDEQKGLLIKAISC